MATVTYWLWLSGLQGLKARTKYALLEHFADPQAIYFANETEYGSVPDITQAEIAALRDKELSSAQRMLERCEEFGADILTLSDAAYPERLKHIYDPPILLFVKGRLPWIDEEVPVAIVGTRSATPYGIKMGNRFGYEITKGGGLVVSGLAAGVDTAGAKGALRAGGRCVGVLGTAIDVVYPRGNEGLFEDVAAVGALVSEFPPGTPTRGSNFPQRNRIISGLSVGVLIIEAPKKSGALITAARALEQGRDVFVVPGNADAPNCAGSNELIKDGAKAVMSGNDILLEYEGVFKNRVRSLSPKEAAIPQEEEPEVPKSPAEPEKPEPSGKRKTGRAEKRETGEGFYKLRVPNPHRIKKKETLESQLSGLSPEQLGIISAIDSENVHVDDIIEKSGLPAQRVLSELTMLQIKGFVRQEKGKRFSLNVKYMK